MKQFGQLAYCKQTRVFGATEYSLQYFEKSYTCEGGAHLRISLAFIVELEKHLLKKLLSGPMKNVRILIFTMLYFFKKQRKTPGEIILHLHPKNLDKIYSS